MWLYVVIALLVIVASGVYFKRKLDADDSDEDTQLLNALGQQKQQQVRASSKFVPKELSEWSKYDAYVELKEQALGMHVNASDIPEEEKKELRKLLLKLCMDLIPKMDFCRHHSKPIEELYKSGALHPSDWEAYVKPANEVSDRYKYALEEADQIGVREGYSKAVFAEAYKLRQLGGEGKVKIQRTPAHLEIVHRNEKKAEKQKKIEEHASAIEADRNYKQFMRELAAEEQRGGAKKRSKQKKSKGPK